MIELKSLSMRYGEHVALHPLDLEVRKGDVFCLLGPNGAGKTTTIRILAGFQSASSGSVRIAGFELGPQTVQARAATAYVPETVALYPHLSGVENLQYFAGLSLDQVPGESVAIELLEHAGLKAEAARRRVSGYSKGMRQKVALALALAKDARALLFDEPTSGLDPLAAHEFGQQVQRLAKEGRAILMATHDLALAIDCGTRVGILVGGRMRDERRTQGLAHSELASRYMEHVLGA
ncbi:MAG: ABC transporter ATP-binding protein [Planctomycetes bacterium]|nr:ABC transporter ATP-binding protein [Planctomycetota bacterium]